jgi:predicted glycosyltransferase
MVKKLGKKHKILCTTRKYREVDNLVKIRKLRVQVIGKHGGTKNSEKLKANLNRMKDLMPIIEKFKPDITISFCSPDAARISFGLQIKHVAFCDAPHAEAVMKLTMPLIQKLLVPWIIPKKEFTKYGILSKNIIFYKSIDAALIISEKPKKNTVPKLNKGCKNILFRTHESSASYTKKKINLVKIIRNLSNIKNTNVIVLGRYDNEIKKLKKRLGNQVLILEKSVDSGEILGITDIFVGSGGTMTAESALRGIPTLSYNAIPNIIEEYLVKKKLVTRVKNINELDKLVLEILNKKSNPIKIRAKKEFKSMENPIKKLELVLDMLNE